MKTTKTTYLSLALWVTLLGGIENAQCFYNPNTGRWLNRDPIGDEAFYSHFKEESLSQGKKSLGAQRLRPSYVFVENDPAAKIDLHGLFLTGCSKPSLCCTITWDGYSALEIGGKCHYIAENPRARPGRHRNCCPVLAGYNSVYVIETDRPCPEILPQELPKLDNGERYSDNVEVFMYSPNDSIFGKKK